MLVLVQAWNEREHQWKPIAVNLSQILYAEPDDGAWRVSFNADEYLIVQSLPISASRVPLMGSECLNMDSEGIAQGEVIPAEGLASNGHGRVIPFLGRKGDMDGTYLS